MIARRGDGSVAMRAAVGEAGGSAFTLERPFRVASVSKMVATTAFLPLALRTGLDLDADASEFVGFRLRHPAWPDVAITPRMLLSHTSGPGTASHPACCWAIGSPRPSRRRGDARGQGGGGEPSRGARLRRLLFQPGVDAANFALLAQMLERRANERFDLHMNRVLFAPLGLDIGYNWSGVGPAKRALAAPGLHRSAGAWGRGSLG